MSQRPRRQRRSSTSAPALAPSIERGLSSLISCNDNASYIGKMLSLDTTSPSNDQGMEALKQCMQMNQLSAEMLLGRFFDVKVLSHYAEEVLEKSGKGSVATLAARIAREWSKPNFMQDGGQQKKRKTKDKEKQEKNKLQKNQESSQQEVDEDDDDGDWMAPLFFWKGILTINPPTTTDQKTETNTSKPALDWQGTWISQKASQGLPNPLQFTTKECLKNSSFHLTSSKCKTRDLDANQAHSRNLLNTLAGCSGTWEGHYLLDQDDGQGPKSYRDLFHSFAFAKKQRQTTQSDTHTAEKDDNHQQEPYLMAAACGNTEFGPFVSAGYAQITTSEEKEHLEFLLARRYIRDDDARNVHVKKKDATKFLKDSKFQTMLSNSSNEAEEGFKVDYLSTGEFWEKALPKRVLRKP